jgi:murein DD-endopeptidase MepM/ murein hydrolase activator NlpD
VRADDYDDGAEIVPRRHTREVVSRVIAVTIVLALSVYAVGSVSTQTYGASPTGIDPDAIGAFSIDETENETYTAYDSVRSSVTVSTSDSVARGGVLTVTVTAPRIHSVQAELVLSDGRSIVAHGWKSGGSIGTDRESWRVLVGIPSTGSLGAAEIHIAVYPRKRGSERVPRVFVCPVVVVARRFLDETIALNGSLTDLRRSDALRRREESVILRGLLNTTDLEGRYHIGRFVLPLDSYRYTAFYGDRRTYRYSDGNSAGSIHNGIDLAAPTGTPVRASARGRVVMAVSRIVTGNTVVIEHLPGVYSLYYHLDSLRVRRDEIVEAREIVGTVGSTGLSTGPHLHWEIRVSGVAVDPAILLDRPRLDRESLRGTLSTIP